ncbi:hypothetical protein PITCH_A1620014 [uncultured Desulfobacterium sp.]|uniref:Uncharacterized protein n=1 Tax=uncultured Desulfobacterium sp. TaxID=201089 RepID=A0A445MU20_9BACT|nr:hypothetical protein PITCH_A1620014 [uncultured Desulfobacterium sp.]
MCPKVFLTDIIIRQGYAKDLLNKKGNIQERRRVIHCILPYPAEFHYP